MLSLALVLSCLPTLGPSHHDELGARIAPLNDVDGDHCADFALDDGLGCCWVVSGKTGRPIAGDDATSLHATSRITPLFGDVDGDGAWDLADRRESVDHRAEYLLRSGRDLHVIRRLVLSSEQGTLDGPIAAAGDWNGDGVPDVAVLATCDRLPCIVVMSAKDGALLHTTPFHLPMSGLSMRDMWLISSCTIASTKRASLALVGAGHDVIDVVPDSAVCGPFRVTRSDPETFLDRKCGFVGDVDGDGLPDLVMRAMTTVAHPTVPFEHVPPNVCVSAEEIQHVTVVVSGRTGKDLFVLPETRADLVDGIATAVLPQAKGARGGEWLITCSGWSGEALVLNGWDRSIVKRIPECRECMDPEASRFGASAVALGDVDGDGVADFAIGSDGGIDQIGRGCVCVFSGRTHERMHVIWRTDLSTQ